MHVILTRASAVPPSPRTPSTAPDMKLLFCQGWGDIYFFCGRQQQYCTCDFRWNGAGWCKALSVWSFVLSSALGVQKLAIQVGFGGLLPGENPRRCARPVGAGALEPFASWMVGAILPPACTRVTGLDI